MKTIRLLLAIILVSLAAIPANARQLFKEEPKSDDISYVYISKAAMQLGMGSDKLDSSICDITSCVSNPEGLEVISANSAAASGKISNYVEEKIKSLDFQLILSAEEGDESSYIYVKDIKNGRIAKGVLIVNTDRDEYNVVYFCGDIDIACISEN